MLEIFLMTQLMIQETQQEDVMYMNKLPPYMPPPLDRPDMWSCTRRPTLCLKGEEDGSQER
jgi:hypothetical protein|tara:strand:- start:650 stop:832 length:183 start_codon:yes stop_codon:yes gene_type:complete